MVKSYTDKQLLDRVKGLSNYIVIPSEYWILGVRSNEDVADKFDDKFYLFKGEEFIMVSSGTTNSGIYGLLNFKKWNREGVFVMKSDYWHYSIWQHGLHKRKMKALVQAREVVGYRDGNSNLKNEEIGNEVEGYFGINFHTVSYTKKNNHISTLIGKWSVGCQVVNNVGKYYEILDYLKNQNRITYCLINEF